MSAFDVLRSFAGAREADDVPIRDGITYGVARAVLACVAELEAALADARSGLRYIRQSHGDLYGVGWDRVLPDDAAALAAEGTTLGDAA